MFALGSQKFLKGNIHTNMDRIYSYSVGKEENNTFVTREPSRMCVCMFFTNRENPCGIFR